MPGIDFERKILKLLDVYLTSHHINAYVKRISMTRFKSQHIDLEVDSAKKRWYLGIECKSVSIKRGDPILFYFSTHFKNDQFERISSFLDRSGRRGFLALEVENYYMNHKSKSDKLKRPIYIVRWKDLEKVYEENKALRLDEVPHRKLHKLDSKEWNVEEAFR